MLTASERRSNDPRVYIAHAHLLLARGGNFNDIKVLAEKGLDSASDKDKALSNLALGQAYLSKNQQFAADYFEKAAKLDGKLKRAVLYRAQLMVQHKGAIDIELAKSFEGDKYDVIAKKDGPNDRSLCGAVEDVARGIPEWNWAP